MVLDRGVDQTRGARCRAVALMARTGGRRVAVAMLAQSVGCTGWLGQPDQGALGWLGAFSYIGCTHVYIPLVVCSIYL